MKQILQLDKLSGNISPSYAQAIHTALFYLIDNISFLELSGVSTTAQFRESSKNRKALSELCRFMLSEFHYELSYFQEDKTIMVLLTFIHNKTLNLQS